MPTWCCWGLLVACPSAARGPATFPLLEAAAPREAQLPRVCSHPGRAATAAEDSHGARLRPLRLSRDGGSAGPRGLALPATVLLPLLRGSVPAPMDPSVLV